MACSPVMANRTSRLAAAALVALPVVPALVLAQSGLTHEVACRADAGEPFSVFVDRKSEPVISSALVISRNDPDPNVCDGFSLALSVQPAGPKKIRVFLPVENTTGRTWNGTVLLRVNDVTTAVPLGHLSSEALNVHKVTLTPPVGESTISAQLIVGP